MERTLLLSLDTLLPFLEVLVFDLPREMISADSLHRDVHSVAESNGDLSEEKKTIALIMATLNSSVSFYSSGVSKSALFPDTPPVAPAEAADFLKLLEAVLTSATVHAGSAVMPPSGFTSPMGRGCRSLASDASSALLQLVFDGPYNILDTLAAVVAPSRKTYVPIKGGDGVAPMQSNELLAHFNALRIAGLHTVKFLVGICYEHSVGGKSLASGHSGADDRGNHLMSLIHAATLRTNLFQYLAQIICSPTAPECLRLAATECLFVLSMRCGLDIALWSSLFEPILKVVVVESSAAIRAFSLAILRQYVVAHPEADVVRANIPLLVKLLATDSSHDVKSLCAQSIEAALTAASGLQREDRANSDMARHVLSVADVAQSSLDRCVTETRNSSFFDSGVTSVAQAADLFEALAKLLQACVLFASNQSSASASSGAAPVDDAALFKQFQRSHVQDVVLRSLGASLALSINAAASTAHLTRLVIEGTMAQACAGGGGPEMACGMLGRMSEATAVGTLVKVLMSIDPAEQDALALDRDTVTKRQYAATEITISVGLLLLFSPQNRQLFRRELQRYPSWAQGLPRRLHQALSSTSLDYFSDMLVVDERGLLLNDPAAVEWDDEAHPSQASVQCAIDAQELGRRAGAPRQALRQLKLLREPDMRDPRRGYLAFVLLGYIFFDVFREPTSHAAATRLDTPNKSNSASRVAADTSAALGLVPDRKGAGGERDVKNRAEEVLEEVLADASGAANHRDPTMFPNLHHRAAARPGAPRQQLTELNAVRTEFDAAFHLATELAQHYHRNVNPAGTSQHLSAANARLPIGKLQNPYEVATLRRPSQLRSWSVQDVHEGDLFFLFIPLAALNTSVVGAVVAKARKHHVSAKKAFITTPQTQKRRRWFLLDLHTTIMPRIIALLQTMQKLLITQGDEHVQLAVSVLPSIRGPMGDKAVYGGNLIKVVDYLSHYFSLNVPGGTAAAKADLETGALDSRVIAANEIMSGFGSGGGSPRQIRGGGGGGANPVVASPGRLLFEVSSSSSESQAGSQSSGDSDLEDRY